jgi:hypothetical protein
MNQSGKCLLSLLSLGLILSVSESIAQDTPSAQGTPSKLLIVNGKTVDAAVVQMEGRSYVDIEGLARGIGGSVTFEPNQITLTIPGSTPAAATATASPAPESTEGMSKGFQQIAVFALAEMREWRGAIGTLVTSGLPVVGTWSQDYHDRVGGDLLQATLAASTMPDNQAVQLLQEEYALLTGWANDVLGERKALDAARTIDPNSLQNDQSLAKISKCGQFLSSMIVGGNFYDDLSCQ